MIHEHAGYHHRYGEDKHCHKQYQAHLLLHEVLGAKTLRHQPSHKHVAEQGCQKHVDDDEDAQTHHDGTAPLRVDLTLAVGCTHLLRVILLVDVRLGVVIRRRHGGDDLQIVLVAVHEYVVLYVVISQQGIVVHLLQLFCHALVVLRVLLHGSPHLDEIATERFGVYKAGVAIGLSHLVEHKRQWHLLAVFAGHVFMLLRSVLAVLGRFASERGRDVLQRLYQVVVALYLRRHTCHNSVVRHATLRKLTVHLRSFMTGVCHVKGEVLLLRVEHERHLITALHKRNHLLVLRLVVDVITRHVLTLFVKCRFQFGAQYGQRRLQVLLFQDGSCAD